MTWLQETRGTRFELLRHFLARFFDSEMVADPDELRKALIGFFAAFASLGIVVLQTFSERYNALQSAVHSTPAVYRQELRADQLLFIGMAMGVTALLTVLHWQSLFPSLRDCLALAGLPIRAREIFAAKFGALLLIFGAFVVSANLPWAVLFASAASGHWQENPSALVNIAANFAATAGACVFVFFSLAGLQGLLLNALPARLFARVSLWAQGLIFIATVGAMPLAARQPAASWWPGTWFLHLWEAIVTGQAREGRAALAAMAIPAAISFGAYLASYGQYRRVLLESPPGRGTARWPGAGSWLLERWIPDPREQAAFGFLWKSLARSSAHRLLLLAYAGLALGWITKGALDMPAPSLRDEGLYGMLVTVSPLALALLVTAALRYLFSLPVALPANWIFRMLDRDGHASWLNAVERFVVWCGIAPVFAASLPASVAVLGWQRAGAVTLLSFLTALLWFELLFRKWRKLGFTCSYLPGNRPAAVTLVRYGLGVPLLVAAGAGILYCSIEPAAFLALCSLQLAVYWRQRRKRLAAWADCSLVYEDVLPAEVSPLDLGEYVDAEGPQVQAPART
ncbi:MAG: hypothetical protein ABUS49_10215, partial [Acidobacteriota bacterium]